MSTRPKHGFPKRLPAFGKKSHMGGPRIAHSSPRDVADGRWSEGELDAAGASVEVLAIRLRTPTIEGCGITKALSGRSLDGFVVLSGSDLILQEVLTRR